MDFLTPEEVAAREAEWDAAVKLCAAQAATVIECLQAAVEFENWANADTATDTRVGTLVMSRMADFDPHRSLQAVWDGLQHAEDVDGVDIDHDGVAAEVTAFYKAGRPE